TSNNYFIDGLYNNDRYYGDSAINQTGVLGIPAVTFPPEAIEELTVQETPSSEFGVKGGAPILVNMKSGTNAWHGGATWINHNGFGDADNYFANHNTDNCQAPGECKPTPIHNNQVHGNIGGPIIKDKAFFFLFYETQHNKSVAIKGRKVPTPGEISAAQADIASNGLAVDPVGAKLLSYFPTSATGTIVQQTPSTASNNEFGVKFDYKLSPSHSLAVRYIFGDSLQSSPPFAGLPPAPGYPQDLFNSVAPSRAQMAGVSWTWNIGNNRILESRTGLGLGYFAYYTGYINGDAVQSDVEELLSGRADRADRAFGDTHRHMYQNSLGFYLQDDWKIKPRFTLNYGLRYEINGTLRDTNNIEANFVPGRGLVQVGKGISGIHNVDYHDFGPHLGFSWDVLGSGKTVRRGGYSLTYDVTNFGALAAPYRFAGARAGVFTQTNLGFFQVDNLSDVASGIGALPFPSDPSSTCYNPVTQSGDYICFDSAVNGPLYGSNPTG